MKGVPDGDEVERRCLNAEVLGALGDPTDVGDTESRRLVVGEGDGVRFLVDGPDLVEFVVEGKGDLPGATRQIEQAPAVFDVASSKEIHEEVRRIRWPGTVVVLRRSLVQIAAEANLFHIPYCARPPPATYEWARSQLQPWGLKTTRCVGPEIGAFQIDSTSESGLATASIENVPFSISAASPGSEETMPAVVTDPCPLPRK